MDHEEGETLKVRITIGEYQLVLEPPMCGTTRLVCFEEFLEVATRSGTMQYSVSNSSGSSAWVGAPNNESVGTTDTTLDSYFYVMSRIDVQITIASVTQLITVTITQRDYLRCVTYDFNTFEVYYYAPITGRPAPTSRPPITDIPGGQRCQLSGAYNGFTITTIAINTPPTPDYHILEGTKGWTANGSNSSSTFPCSSRYNAKTQCSVPVTHTFDADNLVSCGTCATGPLLRTITKQYTLSPCPVFTGETEMVLVSESTSGGASYNIWKPKDTSFSTSNNNVALWNASAPSPSIASDGTYTGLDSSGSAIAYYDNESISTYPGFYMNTTPTVRRIIE
jgi:hypothetical protein